MEGHKFGQQMEFFLRRAAKFLWTFLPRALTNSSTALSVSVPEHYEILIIWI